MPAEFISEMRIRKQAVYFYAVLILWPIYLFFLAPIFAYCGWWAMLYLVFPGLYLFTWLGYLMHESWHKYVPNVNNRFFYTIFALMILTDPQLYSMIHSLHHGQVNTYGDAEFHPIGEIKTRWIRIVYNWLEIWLGVAFLMVIMSIALPRDLRFSKKYQAWKFLASLMGWVIFLVVVGYLSHFVFGVVISQVALSYVLSFWLGSFFLHQSQLVEHGNLIVEGTFQERNLRTRNLKPVGIIEKIFLFLTHNDSREHVLHHTSTNIHSRPFPKTFSLPEKAVMITLSDYFQILLQMLIGKEHKEIVE